jgi:hypothetical protein
MGEALDQLELKLAMVTVRAHPRVTEHGVTRVRQHPRKLDLFNKALSALKTSGGFSLQANGHEPTTGFMISTPGTEETFRASDISVDDVRGYMDKYSDLLKQDNAYFGGWLDRESDEIYLDISVNVQDEAEARRMGKEHKQIAIFDLGTAEKGDEREIRLARANAREVVFLPKDDAEAAFAELQKLIKGEK